MSALNIPQKNTGDSLSASEFNSVVSAITDNYQNITAVQSGLTTNYYTKDEADAKYLTGYTVTSSAVTNALGFTPISAVTVDLSNYVVSSALTQYQPVGNYLTGITASEIDTALGFTPISGLTSGDTTFDAKYLPASSGQSIQNLQNSAITNYNLITGNTASISSLQTAVTANTYVYALIPQLATPTITYGTFGSADVQLYWNSILDAEKYYLYRNTNNIFSGATRIYAGNSTSFDDTGLNSGSTYYYWLNAKGYSVLASNYASGSRSTVIPLGTLYNKSSWTDLTDFVTPSSASTNAWITTGNKIGFSGGTGDFTRFLAINRYTNLPYWTMTGVFKVLEHSSTSYGFGIGAYAMNPFKTSSDTLIAIGRYEMSTSVGNVVYANGGSSNHQTGSNQTVSTSGTTSSVGDLITLTVNRVLNNLYVTAVNQTTNVSATTTLFFPYGNGQNPPLPTTGYLGLFNFGGQFELESLKVTSNTPIKDSILFLGDSKTQQYAASSASTMWTNIVSSNFSNYVTTNLGGGYDRTSDVLNRMPEVVQLINSGVTKVVLNIGSNDKRTGVAYSTWWANYQNIVNQLQASGATVYHLLQLAETSYDFTDYNNAITSTYPANRIISITLNTSTDLAADGVHPNDSGNAKIASGVTIGISQ